MDKESTDRENSTNRKYETAGIPEQREMDRVTMTRVIELIDEAHLLLGFIAIRLKTKAEIHYVHAESAWIGALRWSLKALQRWLYDRAKEREEQGV